jgi:hypothetical protein
MNNFCNCAEFESGYPSRFAATVEPLLDCSISHSFPYLGRVEIPVEINREKTCRGWTVQGMSRRVKELLRDVCIPHTACLGLMDLHYQLNFTPIATAIYRVSSILVYRFHMGNPPLARCLATTSTIGDLCDVTRPPPKCDLSTRTRWGFMR